MIILFSIVENNDHSEIDFYQKMRYLFYNDDSKFEIKKAISGDKLHHLFLSSNFHEHIMERRGTISNRRIEKASKTLGFYKMDSGSSRYDNDYGTKYIDYYIYPENRLLQIVTLFNNKDYYNLENLFNTYFKQTKSNRGFKGKYDPSPPNLNILLFDLFDYYFYENISDNKYFKSIKNESRDNINLFHFYKSNKRSFILEDIVKTLDITSDIYKLSNGLYLFFNNSNLL